MSTAAETRIPTKIEPRAAEFVASLGLQTPLSEIVDHVKRHTPGLLDLVVEHAPAYDSGEEGILILACRDLPDPPNKDCWERFSAWKIARFAPDVWRHFNLVFSSNNQHGR